MIAMLTVSPISSGQTAPAAKSTVRVNRTHHPSAAALVARCTEQLDLGACERALKLQLSPKEKSQVLAFEFEAQPDSDWKLLDAAIAVDPQNALAYFLRPNLKSFLKAIELNPQWKRYYVDAALIATRNPKYASTDEGLKLWQLALENAPDDPRLYPGYAKTLKARGKTGEAEAMLKRGVAANPDDADSAAELCDLYIMEKDFAKLRPACRRAIEIPTGRVDLLAWELVDVKEYALAEAAYRAWLQRYDDGQWNVRFLNLVNVLRQEGKLAEAAAMERWYIAIHPDYPGERVQYGMLLEQMGNIAAAQEQYELAAKDRNDCGANAQLGRFYLHQKRYDDAFKEFEKSYEGQSTCPDTTYILTHNPDAFGTARSRVLAFQSTMLAQARPKDDEKSAEAWNRYGMMAQEFGRFQEELTAYRKAAESSPNEAFRFGAVGWAYYDLHRFREAVEAFEQAEKKQPGYLKSAPEVLKRYQESLAIVRGSKQ